MLVEEDVVIRNLLTLVLQRAQFDVLVAANGQEAIALSRRFENGIDLLITDMEMPDMNGHELGELMLRERPGIRVIQMSGWNAADFAERNLSLAFLQKPFTLTAFLDCIRSVLSAPPGDRELFDCSHLFSASIG